MLPIGIEIRYDLGAKSWENFLRPMINLREYPKNCVNIKNIGVQEP